MGAPFRPELRFGPMPARRRLARIVPLVRLPPTNPLAAGPAARHGEVGAVLAIGPRVVPLICSPVPVRPDSGLMIRAGVAARPAAPVLLVAPVRRLAPVLPVAPVRRLAPVPPVTPILRVALLLPVTPVFPVGVMLFRPRSRLTLLTCARPLTGVPPLTGIRLLTPVRLLSRIRNFPCAIGGGPAVGEARTTWFRFGLLPISVPRVGRSGRPTLVGKSGIPVGRRKRVGPDRPEFVQPLFRGWLAVCVGALVGGPSAEYHLCRHSPTRTTASWDPQRARQLRRARPRGSLQARCRHTQGMAVHEPTGQPSHARLAAATRLRPHDRRSPHLAGGVRRLPG